MTTANARTAKLRSSLVPVAPAKSNHDGAARMTPMTMVKALNLAMHEQMEADENVLVMGQDVGIDEGVFRVTEGLLKKFGHQRVIDTPLAEAGIVGTAIGMSVYGLRPICEIQFSGFSYQAFHQVEQHVARMRKRTGGQLTCPLVIRMPFGGGIRALEYHCESREAYYAHTPGLKVIIPSGPRSARALLTASILSPDPVIFYEPKAVYRAFREPVPDEPEAWELGKAHVARAGTDITLITYGAMVRHTLEAARDLAEQHDVSAEVVDLLSVAPIDTQTVVESVSRTGRAVVIHEAPRRCGVGAEIIARLVENAFYQLEAPIRRVTGYDVHFPYFQTEMEYLPDANRIIQATLQTLDD